MSSTVQILAAILKDVPTLVREPEEFQQVLRDRQSRITASELVCLKAVCELGLTELPHAESAERWDNTRVRQYCSEMARRLHFEKRFREDQARSAAETWAQACGYNMGRLPVISNAVPAGPTKQLYETPEPVNDALPPSPTPATVLPAAPTPQPPAAVPPARIVVTPTPTPGPPAPVLPVVTAVTPATPALQPKLFLPPPNPIKIPPRVKPPTPLPVPDSAHPESAPAGLQPDHSGSPWRVGFSRFVAAVFGITLGAILMVTLRTQWADGQLPEFLSGVLPPPPSKRADAPSLKPTPTPSPSATPRPTCWSPSEKLRRSILLLSGAPGQPMNWVESNDLLNDAADHGEALAIIERGYRLCNRLVPNSYSGIPDVILPDVRDPVWDMPTDANPVAMTIVGQALMDGLGKIRSDRDRAQELFEAAAASGNSRALYNLGILHRDKRQSPSKAVEYFTKAANNGDTWAMANLAAANFMGTGATIDKASAAEWALKSYGMKNPDGTVWVGRCIVDKASPNITGNAVDFYREAAEAGYPEGMFLLGLSLVQLSDPQKQSEGRGWILKAKSCQYPEAKKWLLDNP